MRSSTPRSPSSWRRSTAISRRIAEREAARACCSEMSADTLNDVASSANCRHSRRSDSADSARRASSSAARRSACSARRADMSDWWPSDCSASCVRSAATSASSEAARADEDGLRPDEVGLGLPERALAEARSGTFSPFSGCDAGDRDGLRSGRPRGVVVRALGDDDDDEGVPGCEGGERAAAATATVEGLSAALAARCCPRPDARGLPGARTLNPSVLAGMCTKTGWRPVNSPDSPLRPNSASLVAVSSQSGAEDFKQSGPSPDHPRRNELHAITGTASRKLK